MLKVAMRCGRETDSHPMATVHARLLIAAAWKSQGMGAYNSGLLVVLFSHQHAFPLLPPPQSMLVGEHQTK